MPLPVCVGIRSFAKEREPKKHQAQYRNAHQKTSQTYQTNKAKKLFTCC